MRHHHQILLIFSLLLCSCQANSNEPRATQVSSRPPRPALTPAPAAQTPRARTSVAMQRLRPLLANPQVIVVALSRDGADAGMKALSHFAPGVSNSLRKLSPYFNVISPFHPLLAAPPERGAALDQAIYMTALEFPESQDIARSFALPNDRYKMYPYSGLYIKRASLPAVDAPAHLEALAEKLEAAPYMMKRSEVPDCKGCLQLGDGGFHSVVLVPRPHDVFALTLTTGCEPAAEDGREAMHLELLRESLAAPMPRETAALRAFSDAKNKLALRLPSGVIREYFSQLVQGDSSDALKSAPPDKIQEYLATGISQLIDQSILSNLGVPEVEDFTLRWRDSADVELIQTLTTRGVELQKINTTVKPTSVPVWSGSKPMVDFTWRGDLSKAIASSHVPAALAALDAHGLTKKDIGDSLRWGGAPLYASLFLLQPFEFFAMISDVAGLATLDIKAARLVVAMEGGSPKGAIALVSDDVQRLKAAIEPLLESRPLRGLSLQLSVLDENGASALILASGVEGDVFSFAGADASTQPLEITFNPPSPDVLASSLHLERHHVDGAVIDQITSTADAPFTPPAGAAAPPLPLPTEGSPERCELEQALIAHRAFSDLRDAAPNEKSAAIHRALASPEAKKTKRCLQNTTPQRGLIDRLHALIFSLASIFIEGDHYNNAETNDLACALGYTNACFQKIVFPTPSRLFVPVPALATTSIRFKTWHKSAQSDLLLTSEVARFANGDCPLAGDDARACLLTHLLRNKMDGRVDFYVELPGDTPWSVIQQALPLLMATPRSGPESRSLITRVGMTHWKGSTLPILLQLELADRPDDDAARIRVDPEPSPVFPICGSDFSQSWSGDFSKKLTPSPEPTATTVAPLPEPIVSCNIVLDAKANALEIYGATASAPALLATLPTIEGQDNLAALDRWFRLFESRQRESDPSTPLRSCVVTVTSSVPSTTWARLAPLAIVARWRLEEVSLDDPTLTKAKVIEGGRRRQTKPMPRFSRVSLVSPPVSPDITAETWGAVVPLKMDLDALKKEP